MTWLLVPRTGHSGWPSGDEERLATNKLTRMEATAIVEPRPTSLRHTVEEAALRYLDDLGGFSTNPWRLPHPIVIAVFRPYHESAHNLAVYFVWYSDHR